MLGEFTYITKITDYYSLSILPHDEDGDPVLTLVNTMNPQANILFRGAEIDALRTALQNCEMALKELEEIAERMGQDKKVTSAPLIGDRERRILVYMAEGDTIYRSGMTGSLRMEQNALLPMRHEYDYLLEHGLIERLSESADTSVWYGITDTGLAALAQREETPCSPTSPTLQNR